jgi:hypothetical protein
MKTEPNEVDREAASLFEPAPGMRVAYRSIFHGRVKVEWCRVRDGRNCIYGGVDAIDTDDPATVGCMLAQVEDAAEGSGVTIADRRLTIPGDQHRRFMVVIDHAEGHQTTATGQTRGAALVAVMRNMKGVNHGQ